ncbi:MAG: hypothetical protein WCQ99_07500 [Pseudomonadota bacterium]
MQINETYIKATIRADVSKAYKYIHKIHFILTAPENELILDKTDAVLTAIDSLKKELEIFMQKY